MKPQAQVEYRAIADLKELPGNPRTIKKDQFEKLKQSIIDAVKDEFGDNCRVKISIELCGEEEE